MQNHLKRLACVCITMLVLAGCAAGAGEMPGEGRTPAAGSGAPDANAADAPQSAALPELTLLLKFFTPVQQRDARGFYQAVYPQVTIYQNLVFYDFETLEQRYLCNAPGCTHDQPGCTSYLDTFGSVEAYTYGDNLFLNYYSYNDGTEDRNNWPSAIEKRNLDGTNPRLMITYPSHDLFTEVVFTDGEWLYYSDGSGFVRLNIETYEKQLVAEIPAPVRGTGEHGQSTLTSYTAQIASSYNGQFLWRRLNGDGTRDLLLMHPATGETTVAHTWPAPQNVQDSSRNTPFTYTPDGKGYYVDIDNGTVRCYDIATGEDSLVTDKYAGENTVIELELMDGDNKPYTETHLSAENMNLEGPYDGWLIITRTPQVEAKTRWGEQVVTACNIDTGELSGEIPFQYYANASSKPLIIWGHSAAGLLVTEEVCSRPLHDIGTGGEPYVFDSDYTVYALIDVEDFVNARPNFRTITPSVLDPTAVRQ